jgi:hypothetical protein
VQVSINVLNPVPARIQVALPNSGGVITLSVEDAGTFVKALEAAIANARKAK